MRVNRCSIKAALSSKQRKVAREVVLCAAMLAVAGCATTAVDIVPEPSSFSLGAHRFEGTVNVQALVIMGWHKFRWPGHWFTGSMVKEAIEKSLVKYGLFTRVEQGEADYILDVWVDECGLRRPFMGIGEFRAMISSVWRLTRVRDGKVLFEERTSVFGGGAHGMAPSQKTMVDALRRAIGGELVALSSGPEVPRSPGSASGRPHVADWINTVKQGWPRLRVGMTLKDVEQAIGPVVGSGAIVGYVLLDAMPECMNVSVPACPPERLVGQEEMKGGGEAHEWQGPSTKKGQFKDGRWEKSPHWRYIGITDPDNPRGDRTDFGVTKICWDAHTLSQACNSEYQVVSGFFVMTLVDGKLAEYSLY